jgi:RNA polymerase sigma-70 factor (ECF subfamily)
MNSTDSIALETDSMNKIAPAPSGGADQLFEDHFDAVFRFLSRRIASREDAQDLAAESFAAAVTSRQPRHVPQRAWLYGIARRKLADAFRKRRLTVRLDDTLVDPANFEAAIQIRQLIEKLPPDQREALLLQALEDLSIEEIAHVMHRSRASVKALLQRAKERLRNESQNEFIPEVKK